MAQTSFNKNFMLNTKEEVDSFERIITKKTKGVRINKALYTEETEIRAEKRMKDYLEK